MGHTFEDLHTRGLLKYNGTAGAADILSGSGARIMKVRLISADTPAGAVSKLRMYDAATAAGTDRIDLSCPADGADEIDLRPNGHVFSTGISTGLTGTNSRYEIYYLET